MRDAYELFIELAAIAVALLAAFVMAIFCMLLIPPLWVLFRIGDVAGAAADKLGFRWRARG
jgi:hypothetical protein